MYKSIHYLARIFRLFFGERIFCSEYKHEAVTNAAILVVSVKDTLIKNLQHGTKVDIQVYRLRKSLNTGLKSESSGYFYMFAKNLRWSDHGTSYATAKSKKPLLQNKNKKNDTTAPKYLKCYITEPALTILCNARYVRRNVLKRISPFLDRWC